MISVNNPHNGGSDFVEMQLGEAYKTVKLVSDSLPAITEVSESLSVLDAGVAGINGALAAAQASAVSAENSAIEAEAASTEATVQRVFAATQAVASEASALTSSLGAATATAQADVATTQAGIAAAQASLALSTVSTGNPYANAYASTLPKGVTSGTIGGTAITGATPGTYALTAVGGSITGVQANLVVLTATTARIDIVSSGLGTGTTPPTWANPSGATLPVGTTLTAVVDVLVSDQKTYWVSSTDSSQILLFGNNGGSVATAPFGATQLVLYAKATIDSFVSTYPTTYETLVDYGALVTVDAGDRVVAQLEDSSLIDEPDSTLTAYIYETTSPSSVACLVDAGDRIVSEFGGGSSESGAEIAAARGSRSALVDRLNAGSTNYGTLRTPFWGHHNLNRFRTKIRRRMRGDAVQAVVATHMDSWGSPSYFGGPLSRDVIPALVAAPGLTAVGWAGPGWTGFGAPATGAPKGNVLAARLETTRVGTWTDQFGTNIHSPDECSASSTTSGDYYRVRSLYASNPLFSTVKLLTAGNATIQVSWDDGVTYPHSITLSGASRQVIDLPGVPATALWQLRLRHNGGGTFQPFGILPVSATAGILWHMINATGTQTSAAADPTSFAANALLLQPDIVLLGTPINDRNGSISPEVWATNLTVLIDLWRAWDSSVDIGVIMPPEVNQASGTVRAMDLYYDALEPLIDAKRIAVLPFRNFVPGNLATYANAGTYPLLDSIDAHFAEPNGIALCQDTVLRFLALV